MILSTFFEIFYYNLIETTWLEIVAVIFGLLSVWYARKANILVYPTGIISVLIYVYICFNAMLYADMGINFFYFITSVYGWYNWLRKKNDEKIVRITWNSKKEQWAGIVFTVISYFAIFGLIWIFKKDDTAYINSYIPYIDSFTTSVFLVGMILMARKKVENWIYWIIGDIVSVPLYFSKGLVFTSFQYFVFLILAVLGYIEWKKLHLEGEL
ncbi:MAG: nicotinamide mononucleotide transporter [Bacteroidales bacterium]|jgi:nicotinamide mononucleotide transporter|nr:nicotinamide mononucleotide transporter [Bacteroidales bacterium]